MNLVLTKEQPLKRLVLAPPHDTPVPKPDMPTVLNADSLFVPLKDIPVPTGAALAKVMLLKYVVTEEAIRVLAGVFGSIIVAFADPPNIERPTAVIVRGPPAGVLLFSTYIPGFI